MSNFKINGKNSEPSLQNQKRVNRIKEVQEQAKQFQRHIVNQKRIQDQQKIQLEKRTAAIKKLMQNKQQLQKLRKKKQIQQLNQKKAEERAIAQTLRLQEQKILKENKSAQQQVNAKARFQKAIERQRIQKYHSPFQQTKLNGYSKKQFFELVAQQQRQKAISFAVQKRKTKPQAQTIQIQRPKYINIKNPKDYTQTCLHNPLICQIQQQIQSAMEKAQRQFSLLNQKKIQKQMIDQMRRQASEDRYRSAINKIQTQKLKKEFSQQIELQSLKRRKQLVREGLQQPLLNVRPLSMLQQQINKDKEIQSQIQQEFYQKVVQVSKPKIISTTLNKQIIEKPIFRPQVPEPLKQIKEEQTEEDIKKKKYEKKKEKQVKQVKQKSQKSLYKQNKATDQYSKPIEQSRFNMRDQLKNQQQFLRSLQAKYHLQDKTTKISKQEETFEHPQNQDRFQRTKQVLKVAQDERSQLQYSDSEQEDSP